MNYTAEQIERARVLVNRAFNLSAKPITSGHGLAHEWNREWVLTALASILPLQSDNASLREEVERLRAELESERLGPGVARRYFWLKTEGHTLGNIRTCLQELIQNTAVYDVLLDLPGELAEAALPESEVQIAILIQHPHNDF